MRSLPRLDDVPRLTVHDGDRPPRVPHPFRRPVCVCRHGPIRCCFHACRRPRRELGLTPFRISTSSPRRRRSACSRLVGPAGGTSWASPDHPAGPPRLCDVDGARRNDDHARQNQPAPIAWIYPCLIGSRCIFALLGSGTGPASQAYVADRTTHEERTAGVAFLNAAMGLGETIGPGVGSMLAVFGAATPIYFAAGLAVASAGLLGRMLPEEKAPHAIARGPVKRLPLLDRRVLPFLGIAAALQAVRATVAITLALFFQDTLGLDTPWRARRRHRFRRSRGVGPVRAARARATPAPERAYDALHRRAAHDPRVRRPRGRWVPRDVRLRARRAGDRPRAGPPGHVGRRIGVGRHRRAGRRRGRHGRTRGARQRGRPADCDDALPARSSRAVPALSHGHDRRARHRRREPRVRGSCARDKIRMRAHPS